MNINLESRKASHGFGNKILKRSELKSLIKGEVDHREGSQRPGNTQKISCLNTFSLRLPEMEYVGNQHHNFGKQWAKKFKQGDWNALPTYGEVMKGIQEWLVNQTEAQNGHIPRLDRKAIVTMYEGGFQFIKEAVRATGKRGQNQMIYEFGKNDHQYNLANPYSIIVSAVLYFFTLEMG